MQRMQSHYTLIEFASDRNDRHSSLLSIIFTIYAIYARSYIHTKEEEERMM